MIHFKANLFLSLLAILVLALLLRLGLWQLDRAQEKQNLLDAQSARIQLEPTDIMLLGKYDENSRYLPVSLTGILDNQHQILIDNQVKQGVAGYFVLAPVKLANGLSVLLNRGWVPLGNNRQELPDVSTQLKSISVIGRVDNFPSVGIKLKGADYLTEGWPAVTQVVDTEKVAQRLGYAVLPFQVLLSAEEPNGYDRQWQPMKMGPEKHHGYAFQWFALATAWIIIYFVLTIKRRKEE